MRPLNFVKFATATTGTGDIAVGSADAGFITPAQAGIADGQRMPYVIDDGNDWAFGVGAYSTTGPTLARDANEVRVVSGTKSTAKLSLSGSAKVYFDVGESMVATRPQVLSQASASSVTPNVDNYSTWRFTALAGSLTINAPTGTPYDGQRIKFQFIDDGTERALIWASAYGSNFGARPGSTGDASVYSVEAEFEWNAARSKWICVRGEDELFQPDMPQYVGGKTYTFTGTSSPSISLTDLTGGLASAPAAGDVVIVAYGVGSDSGDISLGVVTSGYAEEQELFSNGTYDTQLSVSWKKMTGTPDTSVQVSGAANINSGNSIAIHVWRFASDTLMDVAEVTATGTGTGRPDPGAITPATENAIILVIGAAGCALANVATFTASELSNFVTAASGGNEACAIGMGSCAWTGGAFNPAAWTGNTTNAGASWAAVTMALRPASAN